MPTTTIEQFREQCANKLYSAFEKAFECGKVFNEQSAGSSFYNRKIADMARENLNKICDDAIAALPLPVMPSQEIDHVSIPSALIYAACHAIDKKTDAPNVLAQLRSYATGAEVMPEQAEPVAYQMKMKIKKTGFEYEWSDCHHLSYCEYLKNPETDFYTFEARALFAQDPSALLARVAELEAENAKLRGKS